MSQDPPDPSSPGPRHPPPPASPRDQEPGCPRFPEERAQTTAPDASSASAPSGSLYPPSPASQAAADELIARKKALVESLDQLVEPLDQILLLMRQAWRGGVALLVFTALMVVVQVHTTLRMVAVQEQLADVVAAQKTLQTTTTEVVAQQTQAAAVQAQQSQITIEPSVTPEGEPTAIVVVKPPTAAPTMSPVPLAIGPIPPLTAASSVLKPRLKGPRAPKQAVSGSAPPGSAAPPPPTAPVQFAP